jgi:hypothetical protein
VLLVHGKPKPGKEDVQKVPTLKEFALRFLDGYAKANRLKPSGIASKETVLRVHLAKAFGDKRLDEISTEDVQRLKAALVERVPKTVNNVLTVLSVVLRTAVEWGVIARVPYSIELLKAPKNEACFHDFDEFERLVEVARSEPLATLPVAPPWSPIRSCSTVPSSHFHALRSAGNCNMSGPAVSGPPKPVHYGVWVLNQFSTRWSCCGGGVVSSCTMTNRFPPGVMSNSGRKPEAGNNGRGRLARNVGDVSISTAHMFTGSLPRPGPR